MCHGDMASIGDVTPSDYETTKSGEEEVNFNSFNGYDSNDSIVLEEELQKAKMLLRERQR